MSSWHIPPPWTKEELPKECKVGDLVRLLSQLDQDMDIGVGATDTDGNPYELSAISIEITGNPDDRFIVWIVAD